MHIFAVGGIRRLASIRLLKRIATVCFLIDAVINDSSEYSDEQLSLGSLLSDLIKIHDSSSKFSVPSYMDYG